MTSTAQKTDESTEEQTPAFDPPKATRMSKQRFTELVDKLDEQAEVLNSQAYRLDQQADMLEKLESVIRHMAAMNGGNVILKKYGFEPMTKEELASRVRG